MSTTQTDTTLDQATVEGWAAGVTTPYSPGDGLVLVGNEFALDGSACLADQVLKRSAANDAWVCADDAAASGIVAATATALGGVLAGPCPANQFVRGFDVADGSPICGIPAAGSGSTYDAAVGGGEGGESLRRAIGVVGILACGSTAVVNVTCRDSARLL